MIETGASPLHQHRIPAHPAHHRLIIGVSDSRLSPNRLWASPRPARPPRYLWSTPVPTPRALKPLLVHLGPHKQPGPGRALTCARAAQLQVGAGCSDLQWAPECSPRWAPDLWRAGVFKRTVIFELFWGELSLKKGQQLVIFRLCWACEGEG